MTQPKVSIIIPVYNTEKYLRECLDSVISQTLKDIEIICIDDGSTDDSGLICDRYAEKDSRIIVIHTANQKPLLARKTGMSHASGEYTCFVDADDFLSRNDSIQKMVGLMEQYGSDIIQFSIDVDAPGSSKAALDAVNWHKVMPREIGTSKSILEACFIQGHHSWVLWNKIFKTDICKRAFNRVENVEMRTAEDAYLYFLICYYSESLLSVETEPFYTYRICSGITSKEQIGLDDFRGYCEEIKVISCLESFLEQESVLNTYRPVIDALKIKFMRQAMHRLLSLDNSSFEEGKEIFLKYYHHKDFDWMYNRLKHLKYKIFDAMGFKKYHQKYLFQDFLGKMLQ